MLFPDVHMFFPQFAEQVLKKFMKEASIEVKDYVVYAESEFRNMLTLEQVCQYEAALFGEYRLKQLGLSDPAALHPEKLQTAVTKLCSED